MISEGRPYSAVELKKLGELITNTSEGCQPLLVVISIQAIPV